MEVRFIELNVDEEVSDDIPTEALLALALAFNPHLTARLNAAQEPHWHKCGHGGIGHANIEHSGCGRIWVHENVPEEHYEAGHLCPACKLGPWYIQFAKSDGTLILPLE